MLQLPPQRGISDAIGMAGRLDETGLRSVLTPYRPNFDVLLAPASPAEGEHVSRDLVTEILKVSRSMYDYVVVDTPPFVTDQVLAALVPGSAWSGCSTTPATRRTGRSTPWSGAGDSCWPAWEWAVLLLPVIFVVILGLGVRRLMEALNR